MARRLLPCLAALALALAASPAAAQPFVFHLRGDQEVPAVASPASGGCLGTLDQGAATFALTCVHDVLGATLMHVHRGVAGANGAAAFDLGDPASPVTATWTGMTPADIAELLAGELYLNIHTAGRPAGEIRGQILPRTVDLVAFTLDGGQVVPPNGSGSTGSCTADLDGPATQLAVSCTHDVLLPQTAHVHRAPAGSAGPLAFTFPSPASPLAGNLALSPQLVAEFAAAFLYVDVHAGTGGEDEGGDEIRGQIGTPPAGSATGTIRIVQRTFPGGGAGFAFTEDVTGPAGAFTLADAGTQTFSAVPDGTYTVVQADPAVTPGGWSEADVSCDDADSTGDTATRTASVSLQAGEVVTCTFIAFALPEPTDSLFVFHLAGDQEVPPVPTPHRGGCLGAFDSGASELDLLCVHDVVGPTLAHLHRGSSGVNGDAVFDLGDPRSPVMATWSGMTPADVADLFAGNLYLNVHTAGRPAGEIRGQVLPRTVDTVPFPLAGGQVVPPSGSTATGSCLADLDAPATALAVGCSHDLVAPVAAHVHEAPAGENGPVVFTFPSATSPFASDVPLSPRLVAAFAATFLYLDVHGDSSSEDVAGDAIRGQIGALPVAPTTGTIRIVKRTLPAGGAGFGFTTDVPGGPAAFVLSDGGVQTFSAVASGSFTVTEQDPTASGHAVSDVSCDDGDSSGNPFTRVAQVALQAGETVTCTFTNVATSTAGELFVFHLTGDQESPPVATPERGGCAARLAGDALTILCTHDVIGASIAHVHRGAPGVNGPVVFDLGDPASPIEAQWTGMTPTDLGDLLAGNLYVNLHTSGRPAGAIRGQLLRRTVDTVAFALEGAQEVPPTPSTAGGSCRADLADDGGALDLGCVHDVAGVTSAHLHVAPAGTEGPVVATFDGTSPVAVAVPMTMRLLADFAAGFLYVNLHTVDAPEGEVRGQILAGLGPVAAAIPTLGEWGALLLALALAGLALRRLGGSGG